MTSPYRYEDPDGDVLEVEPTRGGITLRVIDHIDGQRIPISIPRKDVDYVVQMLYRADGRVPEYIPRTNADKAVTVPDIPGHSRTGEGHG